MGSAIDLTGRRFGRLTALEKVENTPSGRTRWKCQCDCGNTKVVQSGNLTSGHTLSCGCLAKEAREEYGKCVTRDLTGQRFGRLIALEKAERSPTGNIRWKCICDCGNTTIVQTSNLTNGHIRSCGCLSKEIAKVNGKTTMHDLTGKRFGKLIARRYDSPQKKWECKCDCGKICFVSQNNLEHKQHPTISCGCAVNLEAAQAMNIQHGTNIGNIRTKKPTSRSKTGIRGVYYQESTGYYVATIGFQGKKYTLKRSPDIEKCIKAREEAEERIFGDFLQWYDQLKQTPAQDEGKSNPD